MSAKALWAHTGWIIESSIEMSKEVKRAILNSNMAADSDQQLAKKDGELCLKRCPDTGKLIIDDFMEEKVVIKKSIKLEDLISAGSCGFSEMKL